MHWYKTLAWWVIFRCQYTLTSNYQLWGCLNPLCLVLFSAVDIVAKHSSVNKTTLNAGWFPKAFVSSARILNLPITSIPVDNFNDRALWCKPTGINYNMHGWILCRYCATGWFWWIRGLRAMTMWSSSSFTKRGMCWQSQANLFILQSSVPVDRSTTSVLRYRHRKLIYFRVCVSSWNIMCPVSVVINSKLILIDRSL